MYVCTVVDLDHHFILPISIMCVCLLQVRLNSLMRSSASVAIAYRHNLLSLHLYHAGLREPVLVMTWTVRSQTKRSAANVSSCMCTLQFDLIQTYA